jgi:hypothetical protein
VNLEGLTEKTARRGTVYYENGVGEPAAKECRKCGEVKSIDDFAKKKSGLFGKDSKCKACDVMLTRITQQNNPEKSAEKSRKWYSQNRERVAERKRIYQEENREKANERARKWRRSHPDLASLVKQRRRARKSSLPDDFTAEQMIGVLNHFGGCALTGDSADIQWDHVIPLATGRVGTTYGNMIPLRRDLNQSKNNSNILEWFSANQERFELEQERFDRLIEWLGKANGMTVEEYRDYVYECHANPNAIDDAKAN